MLNSIVQGGYMLFVSALRKGLFFIFLLAILAVFNSSVLASDGEHVFIENISCKDNLGILIRFSSKTDFQLIQVDEKQFLIAVKDSVVAETLNTLLKDAGIVSGMSYDKMPGGVTALVFYTKRNIKEMASSWVDDGNSLFIAVVS